MGGTIPKYDTESCERFLKYKPGKYKGDQWNKAKRGRKDKNIGRS